MRRGILIWRNGLGACVAVAVVGSGALVSSAADSDDAVCDCEIRSWVVLGQGRHLYADIDCPDERNDLDGVVEFTTAALRQDYKPSADNPLMPRVARMTRGVRLWPVFSEMEDRVEARLQIDVAQAAALQRDRVFGEPYRLLGPNSNSGLRSALDASGIALPDRVLNMGGPFGQFPGVELDPGEEIPREQWRDFNIDSAGD